MSRTTTLTSTLTLACALAAAAGCNNGGGSSRRSAAAAVTSATTSPTTTATPAPAAPAALTARPGRGALRVEWPTVAGATDYTLYVADVAGVGSMAPAASGLPGARRLDAVTSPYDLVGLTPGRAVHLVVTATGPGGEGPPSVEVAAAALRDDWRLEGADAAHTGHNAGELGRAPVAQAWSRTLGGRWSSAPVVSNGRLFVVIDDRLHALDPATGAAVWTVADVGYGNYQSSRSAQPAVVGDRVVIERSRFVPYRTPRVSYDALDAGTGAVVWSAPGTGYGDGSVSLVPAGDRVLAFEPNWGELSALDLATGDVKWRTSIGQSYYELTSPTVAHGAVHMITLGRLRTFETLTGAAGPTTVLNSYGFYFGSRPPYTPAVVADGTLYAATAGELRAVDVATRAVRWTHRANAQLEAPAVAGGRVFACVDGSLDALDASTGAAAWRFVAGSALEGQPVVGNGVVFAASSTEAYAVDALTGAALWSAPTGGRICVAAGHLFVSAPYSGVVTAYRLAR